METERHEKSVDTENENNKSNFLSWVLYAGVLIGVFIVFYYVIGITVINGNSMSSTIDDGDVLVSSHLFYTPERHDIIVYEDDNGFDVIKRVIGMPNEVVEIKGGTVFINGSPVKEDFAMGVPSDMPETAVHEDAYFVMGDNREPGESLDSRSRDVGPISQDKIKGEAIMSLYPIGFLN